MMLSHRLWARRFGADPGVIGRKVELGGVRHEIVAVLPADFHLLLPAEAFRLKDAEVWRPVQIDYAHLPPRNYTGFTAFGRIRPGVSFAAAQEEMSGIAAQIRAGWTRRGQAAPRGSAPRCRSSPPARQGRPAARRRGEGRAPAAPPAAGRGRP